jgi:hypothetical protein
LTEKIGQVISGLAVRSSLKEISENSQRSFKRHHITVLCKKEIKNYIMPNEDSSSMNAAFSTVEKSRSEEVNIVCQRKEIFCQYCQKIKIK